MGAQELSGDPFHEVLYYFAWWDCPRYGLCVIDGQPTHFDCQFSDELDDYPDEFLLWPATEQEVAGGLEAWRVLAAWRSRFDRGEISQTSAKSPFAAKQAPKAPPAPLTATRAIPTWRLDTNRSFANAIPRHFVQWRIHR
jgi:hypothetical protein